jgi:hypothetical protein
VTPQVRSRHCYACSPFPGATKNGTSMQRGPDSQSGLRATAVLSASARSPVAKAPTNRPAPPPFSPIMARHRRWLPAKEETAGRLRAVWRARLWGFVSRGRPSSKASATGGGRCFRLKHRGRACSMAAICGGEGFTFVEGGLRGSRGHRVHVPARGWRRKRSMLRGGMRGDGHELSILMRLGDGDRAGRGPSNVSTTIILPPQHGQWRPDERSSA